MLAQGVIPRGETALVETTGDRIRRLMEDAGYETNQGLAEAAGVHAVTVSRWLNNRQPPEGSNLDRLAQALGTSPSYIIYGEDNGSRPSQTGGDPRYPDGGISTATQIIETFGRPEALRRQAGHIPARDAAIAGYTLAQRLQLPPAGMKLVLEWHDEIMGSEGETG